MVVWAFIAVFYRRAYAFILNVIQMSVFAAFYLGVSAVFSSPPRWAARFSRVGLLDLLMHLM